LLDLARELNATNSPLSFRSGQELVERFQLHLSPQEAVAVRCLYEREKERD